MDDDRPLLQDLARSLPDFKASNLCSEQIIEALQAAGIDPSDEVERERFRRLVLANIEFQKLEQFAALGEWIDIARTELPDDAPDENVLGLAAEMRGAYEEVDEQ